MPKWRQIRQVHKILSLTERKVIRWSTVAACVGIVWFGFLFVGQHRTPVPTVGGEYTEGVVGSPQLINPLFATVNDVDLDISRLVYSGLLRHDQDQRLLPDLAAQYTVSEDKKTYRFELRQDVVWHDGKPFTARDVAYTFELIQNPQVGSPLFVSFEGVQVTPVDDYTIEFTLKESYQPFLASLTVGILPEHIWLSIPAEQIRLTKWNLQPVGTGPFQFKKFVKDDTGFIRRYELQRYPEFYRNAPFIQDFVFEFFQGYEGEFGAIQALREQKIRGLDFVPSNLRDKVKRKHIAIHTAQLQQYTALFFNQEKQPALQTLEVRKALISGLDKDRILRESLDNEGEVIYSPVLPGFPGYSTSTEKIPYSLDEANKALDGVWKRVSAEEYREKRRAEILEELKKQSLAAMTTSTVEGATSTPPTQIPSSTLQVLEETATTHVNEELNEAQTFYRQDKEGSIIELRLVTADTPEYAQASQLIAGFWEELGVKVDVQRVDPKEIARNVLKGRDYDVLLYGVIIGSDPDQYPFWHSSQLAFPGLNLAQYVNRTVDELLVKARETGDPAQLSELYNKFQEQILKDQPAIFLYRPIYRYATSDDVKGISITRVFHPADRFANVTDWYIKTKGEWH